MWDDDKYRKVFVMHNAIAAESTSQRSAVRKGRGPAERDEAKRRRQRMKREVIERRFCTRKVNRDSSNREEMMPVAEVSPSEDTLIRKEYGEKKEDVDEALDEVRTACPFCSKRFNHEKRLKGHIVTIHRKRAFKCDTCRAPCYTEQNLEKHRKSRSDDYFFECDVCYLKYKRKITLQQHQVRAHSDAAAQFICDSCGRSYRVKVDLLVHMNRKHSTDIHICRYCGKSVTDLHSHEWKHKKRAETASLKLSCHLCVKKFQNRTRLDNHLLLHKQAYKCTECNVVVISSRQLQYHKDKKHKTGTTCPICKKMFLSRGNKFHQHVLTHAGIRPYNCDICGENFTQRSSLFRHRKKHPGPLPPYTSQVPIAGLARNVLQKL